MPILFYFSPIELTYIRFCYTDERYHLRNWYNPVIDLRFQFYSQSVRENKAASHVLQTVWAYKDLRHTLTKGGWNKSHFKVSQ